MPDQHPESKSTRAVRKIALRLPEVEEGASCNKSAFKARKKAFLYMGANDETFSVMVRLGDSLPEAEKLAAKSDAITVGMHGWTTAHFEHGKGAPKGLVERWVEESYRLLAHRDLVAQLDGGAARKSKRAASTSKRTAGKKSATAKETKSTPKKKPGARKKAAKKAARA